MRKFFNILLKILRTIICIPLGIIVAILLMPFYLIAFIVNISTAITEDIWEVYI